MDAAELAALEGHRFPGGSFVIAPYEDWLLRDVLGEDPGDGVLAHPLWAFAAPQQSMGVTIDDIFVLCGASADDGPMLGDTHIELLTGLRLGATYTVAGQITSAVRKTGRTAGTFDLVHFCAVSHDSGGEVVARLTNSFVLPRGETP